MGDDIKISRSEEELKKSKELQEAILSTTDFLIAYMDREFNFIQVNQAYADAARRNRENFIGKNHFDLYPHEENERIFRNVVETGEPFYVYGKPFDHPDQPERGTTYWDWSLKPVKDTIGNVQGVVLSLHDVTERERAKESLRQYKRAVEGSKDLMTAIDRNYRYLFARRLTTAVGHTNDSIIIIDREGVVVDVNDSTLDLFGTNPKGKKFSELVDPGTAKRQKLPSQS